VLRLSLLLLLDGLTLNLGLLLLLHGHLRLLLPNDLRWLLLLLLSGDWLLLLLLANRLLLLLHHRLCLLDDRLLCCLHWLCLILLLLLLDWLLLLLILHWRLLLDGSRLMLPLCLRHRIRVHLLRWRVHHGLLLLVLALWRRVLWWLLILLGRHLVLARRHLALILSLRRHLLIRYLLLLSCMWLLHVRIVSRLHAAYLLLHRL